MTGRYDVVIVGAGIMGVASAFDLKRNNPDKQIPLIDRFGAPGQGNTGRSNAMFRNTFSSADNQVLSDSTIDFYLHVQDELKVDLGLQQIGYLWLMSDEQLSASEVFLKGMERNGIDIRRLSKEELEHRMPSMVTDFDSNEEARLMALPNIEGGYSDRSVDD